MSIWHTIYNNRIVQAIIAKLDIDLTLRETYTRFREWWGKSVNYSIDDFTAIFSDVTFKGDNQTVEEPIIRDLLSRIDDDDIFWDVGADKGLYSCFVSTKIPDENIISFEPHPVRRNAMERNFNRNGICTKIRQEALWSESGTAEFGYRIGDEGGGQFTAQLEAGDTLIQSKNVPNPDILKIDVEGAEFEVIKGLENTLRSDGCRLVYAEVHSSISDFGGSKSEVIQWMESFGFEIDNISPGNEDSRSFFRFIKMPH